MKENGVIIACDFPGRRECMDFLSRFREEKPYVKIGMELFYGAGPDIVREIKAAGFCIFLDLKLHDIPNTVRRTMSVLAGLGVDMCNLHAGGTVPMMEAALCGLEEGAHGGKRPLLLAVTQLTSTSQEVMERDLLIRGKIEDVVCHYAKNAASAGLDGVVCSPLEASAVKAAVGKDFLCVTPGVRFADGDAGDQKRVTTPAAARERGSDYIVMGRPITAAPDPVAAYRRAAAEFNGKGE